MNNTILIRISKSKKQMGYLSTQLQLYHYHIASTRVLRQQQSHASKSLHHRGLSVVCRVRSRITGMFLCVDGAVTAQLGAGDTGRRRGTIRLASGWLVMESLSITTRQLRSSNGGWGRTDRHIIGRGRDRRGLGLLWVHCHLLHGLVAGPVTD
jgi:hypothetical protein